jgi:basic amino acid/polyamine antiporter, APA family
MTAELKRDLGLVTCVLLVVGNIIGVGIFTTPGVIAKGLPSSGWVLTAWLLGGFMAMAGALTYAELGAMFPKAGGNYVFLKEAYGPLWGFLYGWAYSLVTSPGTIALLALGFGEYLGIKSDTWTAKIFSITVILTLMVPNLFGVKVGAGVMNAVTFIKMLAMISLVALGLLSGNGDIGHFQPFYTGESGLIISALLAALVPMAFAYSGWNSTVFVAEEVKNPGRLIPLSMIIGTLLTTVIYLLMNAVYLYAVPLAELVGSDTVAHLTANRLFGDGAARFIQILVATSVLGCLSATLLTNPRTTFAMGRDGLFFKFTGVIHPVHQTPNGAILFKSLWACFLILTVGDFGKILQFVSVPLVIIGTMTVASIFVFRKTHPDQPRPYRCWGYPWVPILYTLISVAMIVAQIERRGWVGAVGIGMFILGIPVYYAWKKWANIDRNS